MLGLGERNVRVKLGLKIRGSPINQGFRDIYVRVNEFHDKIFGNFEYYLYLCN